MSTKVRSVRFNKKLTPEEVAAIMEKYRPDVQMLKPPFYKLDANKNSGYWYATSKCGKCNHEATQRVDHLVNYNLGCAGCKGRKRAEVTKATIAKRTVKKGFVPFSKKQTPKKVSAIVKKHRPDVQMLELPFYKLRPNKNSGDWYVKTKCGKCGYVAIQSVPHLVNYNRGCAGCRDKN